MGRVSYSQEYAGTPEGVEKFPRLKLDKGQTGRILALEAPWSEWVHELRAPKFLDGVALYIPRKRKDGTEYMDLDKEWMGTPICTGLDHILMDKGFDAENCPACAASQQTENIPPPKRRYAMNVVRYGTLPDGSLMQPFNCKFEVWAFTAGVYDKLLRISNEWGGKLQEHDLRVGPPEEPVHFQRFPINALPEVAWAHPALGGPQGSGFMYLRALYSAPGAKATDEQLQAACGRKVPRAFVAEDVNRTMQKWALLTSGVGTPVNPQAGAAAFNGQQAMQQGFGALLTPGLPGQQQIMQPGQQPYPAASPFPQQPQGFPQGQPQQMPQVPANPFGPPPGQPQMHPLEAQAAMQSASQQFAPAPMLTPEQQQMQHAQAMQQMQPPQPGNPFGGVQPQQMQQPQGFPQPPQPQQPSGLDEFHPQTTMNPGQPGPGQPQQQFPQQPQFPSQPQGFPSPSGAPLQVPAPQQMQQPQGFPQQPQGFPQQPQQVPGFAPVPTDLLAQQQPQGQPGQAPQDMAFKDFFTQGQQPT